MLPKRRFLALGEKAFLFGLLAFFAITLHTTPCLAGAGDLDPTFGDGGRVLTDIERITGSGAYAMVLQDDGKLVVFKGLYSLRAELFRFNTDGTLDNSFGDGGVMRSDRIADFLPDRLVTDVTLSDFALQPDGKILVGGSKKAYWRYLCDGPGGCYDRYKNDFYLARFNPDGTLDKSFGIDGSVTTDFSHLLGPLWGEAGRIRMIAIQENGKIVAVGVSETTVSQGYPNEWKVALVRYNTDGTLDTTFGTGGIAIPDLGIEQPRSEDMVLQPDGKIVVAGRAEEYYWGDLPFLARYNTDGTVDNTFGTNGVATSLGNVRDLYSVALQTDGKFVVAGYGYTYSPPANGFALNRLNPDGSVDTSFGTGGGVITDFGSEEGSFADACAVAVQPDGKIVAMGRVHIWVSSEVRLDDFALARYNHDGSPDETFGSDGKVVTEFESREAFPHDMALQNDGKIIAGGNVHTYPFDPNYYPRVNLALVRYNTDGALDNGFGTDGTVIKHGVGVSANYTYDMIAYQGDGKFLVGGISYNSHTNWDFAITRHNADGSLDTTFGERGWVTTDFSFEHEQPCDRLSGSDDRIQAIAVQPDGKIIAVGFTFMKYFYNCAPEKFTIAMARYLPDGSLDETFGNEGKVITTNYNGTEVTDVVLQPDGKIVLAGAINHVGFAVFRFNPDGSPDTDFGTGGFWGFDPFPMPGRGYFEYLNAVALQPDGKIVVAGTLNAPTREHLDRWVLFRLNPDGSLDTTFGEEGLKIYLGGGFCSANDLVLQPDGKIVVTGRANHRSYTLPGGRFTLIRYLPDGSLDSTFGTGGIVFTDFGVTHPWVLVANEISESIALQPDGRIVVAGVVNEYYEGSDGNLVTDMNFGLLRYNPDGSLDYTFGNGGKVTTDFGDLFEGAFAVTIRADGKILAAGISWTKVTGYDFAIARYEGLGNVVIDGCDSGVLDQVYNEKFISQWIRDCETGAENHGEFESCVTHLTNDLKKVGPISNSEKGSIQSCAAQSNIPWADHLTIDLTTDRQGWGTYWQLVDLNTASFIDMRDRNSLASETTYSYTYYVDTSHCYEFTISDSNGDGICCQEGEGNYFITFDGVTTPSPTSGAFGFSETVQVGNCP